MTFFPSVDPVSKLRLIEVWSLRATVFFAALAAIFLGAFSVPSDYEQKRIYVLASKPVSKITYLLGKYLGFLIVIAVFVGTMGLITVAYLRLVKLFGGAQIPELRARPRVMPTRLEGMAAYELHPQDPTILRVTGIPMGALVWTFANVDPATLGEPVLLRGKASIHSQVSPRWSGRSLRIEIQNLEKPFHANVPVLPSDSFELPIPARLLPTARDLKVRISPGAGDLRFEFRTHEIAFTGSKRAVQQAFQFETEGATTREDDGRISAGGCAAGALQWHFENLDPADFPETVSARVRLRIEGARDPFRFTGLLRAVVETADGSLRHEMEVSARSQEWASLQFPRKLMEAKQPLDLFLLPGDSDLRLTGKSDGALLFESNELFEWSFLKGLALLYMWIAIIMSVTLMTSAFLSAPISILMGVLVLLVGSTHAFVTEGVRDIDRSLAQAREAEHQGHAARTPEDLPPWLLEASNWLSKRVLTVFPSEEPFDYSRFLLNDLAVQGDALKAAFLAMLPRVLAMMLLGILVMFFRDFG